MQHTIKEYQLTLIDEPTQAHVVAWETASRKLKSEDAKPLLRRVMTTLSEIRVTDGDLKKLMAVFQVISDVLKDAMQILDDNESLTLSANRGVMVKAAIMSGWIMGFRYTGSGGDKVGARLKSPDEVDKMPPWLVQWIAERIAGLYMEVTEIPKN